jgi:hypothetical protein
MYNASIFGFFQINSLPSIKSEKEEGFFLAALAKSSTAVLEVKVHLSEAQPLHPKAQNSP